MGLSLPSLVSRIAPLECAPSKRTHAPGPSWIQLSTSRPASDRASLATSALSATIPAASTGNFATRNSGFGSSLPPLATYQLPQQRRVQRWLDETIRHAVQHLREAPFLQATTSTPSQRCRLQRFHVTKDVGSAPHLWQGVVQHLSGGVTDSVMYVSPLTADGIERGDMLANCTSAADCAGGEVLSGVVAGLTPPLLQGQVGNCCHEVVTDSTSDAAGPRSDDHTRHFTATSHAAPDDIRHGDPSVPETAAPIYPAGRVPGSSAAHGQLPDMYGVVIQSGSTGGLDGCFVLKTLKHEERDCHCISYTLTKLCS